jgi:TPR repeat protein
MQLNFFAIGFLLLASEACKTEKHSGVGPRACPDAESEACCSRLDIDASKCALGDAHACLQHALAHGLASIDEVNKKPSSPAVRERHQSKSTQGLIRACDLGSGDGCWRAARALIQGDGAGVDRNHALAMLDRGCDLRSGVSCAQLANAYEFGSVRPADPARAESLYKLACTLDPSLRHCLQK